MKNMLLSVLLMTILGCSAKPTPSGQIEGEQQSNKSSDTLLERTIGGTWIDQDDIKWAFTDSRFFHDGHFQEPDNGKMYDLYDQTNGAYQVAGNRLILHWQVRLYSKQSVNSDLANQIIELTWLDDTTVELKPLGEGFWGSSGDWRDEIAILKRQSRDVSSSDKSWINKRLE